MRHSFFPKVHPEIYLFFKYHHHHHHYHHYQGHMRDPMAYGRIGIDSVFLTSGRQIHIRYFSEGQITERVKKKKKKKLRNVSPRGKSGKKCYRQFDRIRQSEREREKDQTDRDRQRQKKIAIDF